MDDKSFEGMSDKEKLKLLRRELTALQKKVAQDGVLLNDLLKRVDRLEK